MLSAGSTVLTLSLTRPVWVRAYIDEPNLGQMQPGRELLLYTDGRPDKPYHGKVGFVSPTAEFTPKPLKPRICVPTGVSPAHHRHRCGRRAASGHACYRDLKRRGTT